MVDGLFGIVMPPSQSRSRSRQMLTNQPTNQPTAAAKLPEKQLLASAPEEHARYEIRYQRSEPSWLDTANLPVHFARVSDSLTTLYFCDPGMRATLVVLVGTASRHSLTDTVCRLGIQHRTDGRCGRDRQGQVPRHHHWRLVLSPS